MFVAPFMSAFIWFPHLHRYNPLCFLLDFLIMPQFEQVLLVSLSLILSKRIPANLALYSNWFSDFANAHECSF
jgi:hypothetical protein